MTEHDDRITNLAIEGDDRPPRFSSVSPGSPLGAILWRSAAEEGGVRNLAREIGLSHDTVYRLIRGTHVPSRHCARAVADYLAGRNRRVDEISVEMIIGLATERGEDARTGDE